MKSVSVQQKEGAPIVVKADGLAASKGVVIAASPMGKLKMAAEVVAILALAYVYIWKKGAFDW